MTPEHEEDRAPNPQGTPFLVDDQPYCLWLDNVLEKNTRFLEAFNTRFFRYQLETNTPHLDSSRALEAAIALRVVYHHVLETFLMLLFGNLQALDCIVGYLHRCRPEDLRSMIRKVNRGGEGLYTRMRLPAADWASIANFTIPEYADGDPPRSEIVARYAKAWAAFGRAYRSDAAADEYNSLKHGFRAGLGGLLLDLTIRMHGPGGLHESPPIRMGEGDCGTFFFTAELVPSAPKMHFGLRFNAHNWDPHKLAPAIRLLIDSIEVVLLSLKLRNGMRPKEVELPVSDDLLAVGDDFNGGAPSSIFFMGHEFSAEHIVTATRDELLDWIEKSELRFEQEEEGVLGTIRRDGPER